MYVYNPFPLSNSAKTVLSFFINSWYLHHVVPLYLNMNSLLLLTKAKFAWETSPRRFSRSFGSSLGYLFRVEIHYGDVIPFELVVSLKLIILLVLVLIQPSFYLCCSSLSVFILFQHLLWYHYNNMLEFFSNIMIITCWNLIEWRYNWKISENKWQYYLVKWVSFNDRGT